MRISSRTRYGIRLMVNLARNYGQGYSLLKNIAKSEAISEKYLSLIVIPLRSIGLLNTLRGSKGGYMLARPPSEISIKNIMDILEEDLNLLENIKKEEDFVSPNEKISRDLWLGLGEKIKKYLGSITLKDLIETYDKKNKKIPVNYYI